MAAARIMVEHQYGPQIGACAPVQPGQKSGLAIKEKKQAVEREEILKALEQNRWNKTQTAESLGISRRSLLYKIKEFGIA